MGLNKLDVDQGSHRGESVGSTSSSPEPRRWPQSGQAPQRPSAAINQAVIASPRPHASSVSPVDLQAARLSRASIHDPSQNPSAINPRPPAVRAGTFRRDVGSQISSHGSAATRSQNAHPATTRREDHPRARPTYLGTARPETSSSPAPRREDFAPLASNYTPMPTTQPAPKKGGLFGESRSDLAHAISALRARGILPSLSGEFSIGRGYAQEQSTGSVAHSSGRRGRHIYKVIGAGTGVGTDLGISGEDAIASRGNAQDSSVAPTGDQFCPNPVEGVIFLPGYDRSACRRYRSPTDKIGVGIETEFLLKSLRPNNRQRGMVEFGEVLAAQHDLRMLGRHPAMDNNLADPSTRIRLGRWALTVDHSMDTVEEPCALSSSCLI